MRRDVRKEVQDALLDEQGHVPIGLPPLCRAVHLKRLPHELGDPEEAQHCVVCALENGTHFRPDDRVGMYHAK